MASSPISPIRFPVPPELPGAAPRRPDAGFEAVFRDAVGAVEGLGANARARVERFLSGEGENLHEVALDSQRAQLAFELFQQVRNKVVEAYQEVMRTQI